MTYPTITRAVEIISSDNGGHLLGFYGVGPTPDEVVALMIAHASQGLSTTTLALIEAWLAALSEADLDTLCMGEHSEGLALGAPDYVETFLNNAFEAPIDIVHKPFSTRLLGSSNRIDAAAEQIKRFALRSTPSGCALFRDFEQIAGPWSIGDDHLAMNALAQHQAIAALEAAGSVPVSAETHGDMIEELADIVGSNVSSFQTRSEFEAAGREIFRNLFPTEGEAEDEA